MNTSKYMVPLIFLGTAVGEIRRGNDGLAIVVLCGVALVLLISWGFDEYDAHEERKRRAAEAERRRSRY